MKTVNLGHWRIAFLAMTIIALSATLITTAISALAFLVVMVGLYLGFELFVIFNMVFSITQYIAYLEQRKVREEPKDNILHKVAPK